VAAIHTHVSAALKMVMFVPEISERHIARSVALSLHERWKIAEML
jgi:hypothetical protein